MDISQFNPLIRYIDKRCNLNSYSNPVVAFDHRFFYVSKGEIHIVLNDKKFILKVNEALIVPPCLQYQIYSHNHDTVLYIVNFDYIYDIKNEDVSGIPPVLPECFDQSSVICDKTCDAFPMKLICCEDTADKLGKMIELYCDKPMLYKQCMSVIFKETVIYGMVSTAHNKMPDTIKKIVKYIDDNIYEKIDNKTIAKRFMYHPNYLNRIFKRHIGEPLHHYVRRKRLEKTQNLILSTDMSISEIACKCGFITDSYYIKCFLDMYGITPYKYRIYCKSD